MQQRRGEVQAALHAAGVALDAPVDGLGQADQLGHLAHLLVQHLAAQAVQARLQGEQLAAGLLGVEAGLLQGDPDQAADRRLLADDVVPEHRARAGGRLEQRCQYADSRRFSSAVRPEEAIDLTLLDLEADAADSLDLAEPTHQVGGFDSDWHPLSVMNPRDIAHDPARSGR